MNTKKLTPLGKIIVFVLFLAILVGGAFFFGLFDSKGSGITASGIQVGGGGKMASKVDVINLSLDEWIGWKSVIDANGGLKTKPGSIYDKLGLKVNISIINDATQSSNALIKGSLHGAGYTVNRYAFLYPKFEDAKVPVVMPYITNFSTGGDGIIAKSNISSIEGLVDKKIGVPRFSEAQTLVIWLLQHSSLNQTQIDSIMKNMVMFDTPDDAAKAFFAGKVDAAATWQPYLSQAQETSGAKVLFSTKNASNIVLDGLVFRKDFLDANKDQVAKLAQGAIQAASLYTTDTTTIKDSMPLFSQETAESIKSMTGDATLATYSDNTKLLAEDGAARLLFSDMSKVWKAIGEKADPTKAAVAFDGSIIKSLDGKFDVATSTAPKFTEKQRTAATNTQALLKQTVTVNFQSNSAAFVNEQEAFASLDKFVATAKILDGSIIQIEGNIANASGVDNEFGRKLSQQRAKAVSMYLQTQGVDPSRFVVIGNGSSKPTGDNSTEEGQKMNRRTDVFFKLVE